MSENKCAQGGTRYYLAVDIGASSGRHILSHMENGRLVLEEIYRFPNGMEEMDGHLCWNTEKLFDHILAGMRRCHALGKIPVSMGIDTWAVDFVLLDEHDQRLGNCVAYRDGRTTGMDQAVYELIPEEKLYARTGIQKAIFNTIYQLMALKKTSPELLGQARSLLMVPDYFHFLLTGVKKQEYTNATTTQLVNPKTKEWDYELIELLGYPAALFGELSMPGSQVGRLREEIRSRVGFDCQVVLPATHDTASAVMSVPCTEENCLYISSGTWSLMGCELLEADCSSAAQKANFTNEGGYAYRYRFLKNIMGLWMIQSVKKELDAAAEDMAAVPLTSAGEAQGMGASEHEALGETVAVSAAMQCKKEEKHQGRSLVKKIVINACGDADFSFAHLCERAAQEEITSWVDANDASFLAPASMTEAVCAACAAKDMEVPQTPWALAAVIYHSLARCYQQAARELEQITGRSFDTINVVGGGSNAVYLNELTAVYTGKTVNAGPGEATAIGNLGAQLLADGVFTDLNHFRETVFESFGVKQYRK